MYRVHVGFYKFDFDDRSEAVDYAETSWLHKTENMKIYLEFVEEDGSDEQ